MNIHTDLLATVQLLEENYSGYRDKLSSRREHILAARDALLQSETNVAVELDQAICNYLAAFADGHVSLQSKSTPPKQQASVDLSPSLEMSPELAWLRVPSFDPQFSQSLSKLLEENHTLLCDGRTLIIDLRDNRGGCDDGFEPLLPYVMSEANYQVTGMAVLSTPANIAGWEKLPELYPSLPSESLALIKQLTLKMRLSIGQFVLFDDKAIHTKELKKIHLQPSQVLILMNHITGSSAEEFLLAAKQSARVTLIGENSAGVLDYSNVREFPLPSGQRSLWLATSRSLRLPEHGIDGIGIPPDIPLPTEILQNPTALHAWFCTYLEQTQHAFAEEALLS
ncbi:S41 family peptidase [Deefgea rivuli]|uniref:S41 family peptidase n=1 Tax=Deefgea rivuli TaxID=400948 RepID=UPI0004878CB6|nr:S41 family peptidase [Deefgea rivuli]